MNRNANALIGFEKVRRKKRRAKLRGFTDGSLVVAHAGIDGGVQEIHQEVDGDKG
jgi:hypothetical protein